MEPAYIYVRVSTDEQKRKGYSLIEQEDRLLKHCEINHIKVKGIFREDFSAKDFNRPEWKKLVALIKRNKHRPPENILFLKWDRFSRNIEFAYQMIGHLKELNTLAMAIDQPIDFEVPESIVMLAIYLSIPEAENSRRGRNSSDGMRRAKKMGRWPGKAPMGYTNQTASDGKKFIAIKHPEADYIKWSFQQFAKGLYSISQVRKVAILNGLKCSRNNFWKLLHNPVYCGIVTVPQTKTEEIQFVKGVHDPLITEELFNDVQLLLNSKRRHHGTRQKLNHLFPLRGFLHCPWCGKRLTGSISTGGSTKSRYYHCTTSKCPGRFRADILDRSYEDQLKSIHLAPEVYELFELVLQDENILFEGKELVEERKTLLDQIIRQQSLMSKARNLLLTEKIDFNDFSELKREHRQALDNLNDRLTYVNKRLIDVNCNNVGWLPSGTSDIFQSYINQDIAGKRHIISLFSPTSIDAINKKLGPLQIDKALTKIIRIEKM